MGYKMSNCHQTLSDAQIQEHMRTWREHWATNSNYNLDLLNSYVDTMRAALERLNNAKKCDGCGWFVDSVKAAEANLVNVHNTVERSMNKDLDSEFRYRLGEKVGSKKKKS